jgi:predicted RNA binding protein YcfA (HicA-like mRNA interferase family)
MAFPPNVWDQLKNLTAGEFARALERDAWTLDARGGSAQIYRKVFPSGASQIVRRVSIHYHAKKTCGAKTLQGLLDATSWTTDDLRRLKLIK